jgi:hypothetical protein
MPRDERLNMGARNKRIKRRNGSKGTSRKRPLSGDELRRSIENYAPLKQLAEDHPKTAELDRAFFERFARAADAWEKLKTARSQIEIDEALTIIHQNAREALKIATDFAPPGLNPSGPFDIGAFLTRCIQRRVLTRKAADAIESEVTARKKGRPSKLYMGIAALDFKQEMSWPKVADKVCDCGAKTGQHSTQCVERVRYLAREAKKRLRDLSSGGKA